MSNTEEKYDQDVRWFRAKSGSEGLPDPTDDQEFSFAERISFIVQDNEISENDAREMAFKGMF